MDNSQPRHLVGITEAYNRAYAAVLSNPYWFSDRPRLLNKTFSAENTRKRAELLIDILHRAARRRREHPLAEQYLALATKLAACPHHRCGSSACLNCLRAFQQAKSIAHRNALVQLATIYPNVIWCVVTIIPLELNYPRGTLNEFNVHEFNHHLTERFAWDGLIRPFLASIDFSLEASPIGKYWQPHWHLALHTYDPNVLRQRLKELFPPIGKYAYPVDVAEAGDLNFLPYIHKVIKIPDLLRTARSHLPELLLALDRINPLDLLAYQRLVLSAQSGGFNFQLPR